MSQTDVNEQAARRTAHGAISQDDIDDSVDAVKGSATPGGDTLGELETRLAALEAAPGVWTTIKRGEGNQAANSTTLTNDAALQFAAAANKNYIVRGRFDIFNNGTPGVKFAINFPSEANGSEFIVRRVTETGGTEILGWYKNPTGAIQAIALGFDRVSIEFAGTFCIDGTGGTWAFQHAQDTSDAAANIIRGGYIDYMQLPTP